MKKNYFMGFIACAALTMTGCSNDEIGGNEGQTQGEPIEFGTYLGRDAQARGGGITTANLENFGVFAFYTGQKTWKKYDSITTPNFMNNQEVTKGTDGSWAYSPLKYWPNNENDKVSFFAYAPYDKDKSWSNDQKISFTVVNDVKKQKDLLACWTSANTIDLTKQAISGKVTFNFGHALSRIGLQVAYAKDATSMSDKNEAIDGSTVISVQEVTLGNATNGTFYKTGNLFMNAAKADWTPSTEAYQSFKLESGNFVSAVAAKVTNAYQDLNADNSYVMIIPQDLSADQGFPVTIKYTVTTTDSNNTANSSTIENTITNTAKIKFEAGKAYTLKLLLGMTSVKLSASVTEWGTSSETTVNLPQNNQ